MSTDYLRDLAIRMLIGIPATVALIVLLAAVGAFVANRRGGRS